MKHHRTILHLDLDAFYCAVEEQNDPTLIGKPFAVGGRPEERGVVSSCSYAARRRGVHSAMPMAQAIKVCPGLRIVSPHHAAYSAASAQIMERLRQLTPLVEQISIDEAFLEATHLPEEGEVIARSLQATIRRELNLPCSLGVASNKLVAKIANDVGKAEALQKKDKNSSEPPNAIKVVPPGTEADFLAPLNVRMLWGVGPKTAERLADMEIYKIGDLAAYPSEELLKVFGKNGLDLSNRSKGIDSRPIVTESEPKSISQEVTFARDVNDGNLLRSKLVDMALHLSKNLKKKSYLCATVKIKLRWPSFKTITRQITLPVPTDQQDVIAQAAVRLFEKEWQPGMSVRLIGIGVSNLGPLVRQLGLWDELGKNELLEQDELDADRQSRLLDALDDLNQRYGDNSVLFGKQFKSSDEEVSNGTA